MGNGKPLSCKCKTCRYAWKPTWATLSQGHGCPHCGIENKRLTQVEVEHRLKRVNPTIKILGKYEYADFPILCRCLNCLHEWKPMWSDLVRGSGCPSCRLRSENEVRAIVEKVTGLKFPKAGPTVVPWLHGLHLDGYNRRHKLAFEYQGPQHYELTNFGGSADTRDRLAKRKRDDSRKRVQCWRHGVKLVSIPYYIKDVTGYVSRRLGDAI